MQDIPSEAPRYTANSSTQNATDNWPSKGAVSLRNVCLRYRPNLPLVLKNLSVAVEAGQKIGIVGRTGAGKRTVASKRIAMLAFHF